MKLFDTIEAVKFPEENMIFITSDGYLYYIYDPKYKWWRKNSNAGNYHLTVSNYPDVSREELVDAMKGVFPKKETDFMRLCNSSQLCIRDMLDLLKEDYPQYMADYAIYHTIHRLLSESDICHKSFEKLQKLLEDATANHHDNNQVLTQIKNLSFAIIGRDIFKRGTATYQLVYAKNLTAEEVAEYNANRPTEDDTAVALVVDFYQRFLYRMEYMLKVGKEKGYNLISFMGP